MKRHVLLALISAVAGQDEEFNRWYEQEHLAEVLTIPGFVSARRFRAAAAQLGGAPQHGYLTIYEIETDDINAAVDALKAKAADISLSDSMDLRDGLSAVYTLLSERSTAAT